MVKNTLTFNVSAHGREEGKCDYNKLRDMLLENGYVVNGNVQKNGDAVMLVEGIEYDDFLDFADEAEIDDINDYVDVSDDNINLEDAFEAYDNDVDECEDDIFCECDGDDCNECNEDDELSEDLFVDFDDEAMFDDEVDMEDDILSEIPDPTEFDDELSDEEIEDMSNNYYSCLDDDDLLESEKKPGVLRRKRLNESNRKRINRKRRLMKLNESCKTLRRKRLNEPNHKRPNRLSLSERRKRLNERYAINKRKGCCGDNTNKDNRLYSLSEALKAFDPKQQKKLDKSVKSIEDIVKDIKGQSIGQGEVMAAFKKLKAEQNALKKITKNDKDDKFKVTDITGVSAIIKKMIDADPEHAEEIKKFKKSLTESVVTALQNKKKSLYENVKIDGKSIQSYKSKKLHAILKEAKVLKAKYTKSLKTANPGSELSEKLKKAIDIKNKLINILNEELSYRYMCYTVAKPLFEEDKDKDKEEKSDDSSNDDGGISDEDLAKMFGTADDGDDSSDDSENSGNDENNSEEDEEVEIARVVIDMASKEDAEDMKQHCIDAGIPEDAIEIEEGEESDEDDSDDESDENSDEEANDENSDENANESIRYSELRKLFEDEEVEDDSEESDNDEASDEEKSDDSEDVGSDEDEESSVKFILTNTDYIDELAEVLNDVYGISNEEFEDMIGGEIVKDDEDDSDGDSDEDDSEDEEKSDDNNSSNDTDNEDEISASDIFGNM